MTNPQGYMFISYRSTQLPVVLRLRRRLEEFGIPVWHDKDSMPPGMLEKGMRDAVRHEDCAGAIVWLSRDVAASTAIQRIELPEIFQRVQRDDQFFVGLCLADGLTFDTAQAVIASQYSNINVKSFLLLPIGDSSTEADDIENVSRLLLEKRLSNITSRLEAAAPLRIYVAGHVAPPATVQHALVMDYRPLFERRIATGANWARILSALDFAASSVARHAQGRVVLAEGRPQLSLALALGYAFRTPRGIQANWQQINPDSTSQEWSLESLSEPQGFGIKSSTDLLHGQDMAVLIGITNDPGPTFDASASVLPRFGVVIRLSPKDGRFPASVRSSSEASALTQAILREIRSVVRETRLQGSIHFFIAGPAGVAFLLGRQLNTLGTVHCYEHEASGLIGVYRPNLTMNT